MAVDERRRSQLFAQLADVLGDEAATTMGEMLPAAGVEVATSGRIDDLERRVDARFEIIDVRFDAVDARFDAVDARFDGVDQRLARLESGLGEVRRELFAVRGEIVTAVSGQTRTMLIGMFTAIVSIAGLSWTFAAVG